MDLYPEDVTLTVAADTGPNPGVYEGKEAVGEWFGDWFRSFAPGYRFEIQEARELDGGVIFLFATHAGRGRVSGVEVTGETGYLYRVLAGKISQVGFFSGREEALEAVSLREWSEAKTD